jgi:SAM-dependent methyltransferase
MKRVSSATYYTDRLVRYARANGLQGLAGLVGKNLVWPYCQWLTRRRIRAHEKFDLRYGLDTQTPIPIRHLESSMPAAQFAIQYEGAPIKLIDKTLRQLKTDLHRFTFIDLGSGKGRVLLIAAKYPFKSVIGVEFSQTLHSIAQSNIKKFTKLAGTKTGPISINIDAADFDFLKFGDKIIFCNNPFKDSLMIRVLDNLEKSVSGRKNEVIFIYLTPITLEVKKRLDKFDLIRQGNFLSHYGGFQRYYIYRISSKRTK